MMDRRFRSPLTDFEWGGQKKGAKLAKVGANLDPGWRQDD